MKKAIAVILAVLLVLSGCSGDQKTPAKKTDNPFAGAWIDSELWRVIIFDDNGETWTIWLDNNSRVDQINSWKYHVTENELTLNNGRYSVAYKVSFLGEDSLKMEVLTGPGETLVFNRLVSKHDDADSIVHTWEPVNSKVFELNVGSIQYGEIEKLSFYNDGTYRAVYQNDRHLGGEYGFLYDGEVLEMECGSARAEFKYEFLGHGLMLLEYAIYHGEASLCFLLKTA